MVVLDGNMRTVAGQCEFSRWVKIKVDVLVVWIRKWEIKIVGDCGFVREKVGGEDGVFSSCLG